MTFAARTIFGSSFTPVLRTYTTGSTATETAPEGASNVIIAIWGAGGGGGAGWFSDTDESGCGGGSGAYVESSYSISGGQTLIYTVGVGGNGATFNLAQAGTPSLVSSGTKSITEMSAGGGGGGGRTQVGLGGEPSGGTTTNTEGNAGSISGVGGAAVVGYNSTSSGAGGEAGVGTEFSNMPGQDGEDGLVLFYYT